VQLHFNRHYYFHSGMDLGNQDQVVWNTAQGRPFARSIEVTNDLGDHIRPYLVLLSPIYIPDGLDTYPVRELHHKLPYNGTVQD
jgi:uncharacterized membrane protein